MALNVVAPRTDDALTPILASIPLQLLAYHVAVLREANVDLAKSVTVEQGRREAVDAAGVVRR